jgi:MoxR-like ATPase
MNKVEEFYAQKKGTFLLESKKRNDIMAEVKAYLDEDTIIAEMSNLMEVTPLDQWSINKFLREIRDKARAGEIKQTVETVEVVDMEKPEVKAQDLAGMFSTMAKFSAQSVLEEVLPKVNDAVEKKLADVQIVEHHIKVANNPEVVMECELPPVFDEILAYASNGLSVMMTGPAGTGKGFMARQVAKCLNAEFFEVNAVKNNYELTGFVDANSRYNATAFYDACKASSEGKKAVFLFDEMDCSDAESLKVFNEALEAREFTFPNNEKLQFEDLIILSACNTFGTGADEIYCGNQLDASTLNRFVLKRVDYNRKIEMKIAQNDESLCDFIDMFRAQTEKTGMQVVISYRNIKQITRMKDVLPLPTVMKDCLVKSMADDDLKNILNNIRPVLSENRYFKATEKVA